MDKKIISLLLAMVMVFSSGCAIDVNVDTGKENAAEDVATAGEESPEVSDVDEVEDTAGDEAEDDLEEYDGGLRIRYPEAFANAKGITDCGSYEIDYGTGVYDTYFSYMGLTEEWIEEHMYVDEPTPEDREKYSRSQAEFTNVLSIDNNRGLDELVRLVNETDEEYNFEAKDYTEIAKVDDCTFYRLTALDKDGADGLDEEFRKEFDTLYDLFDEILENAEYFKPVDPYEDMIGKKIEFKTTDIDGNPITSDEIFSKNDVTMVNVWATWCYWCIKELPELNGINDRLAKKNCAVVGIVGDGTDDETIAEAKDLLKENGDKYLNILPWEDAFTDDLSMSEGWPTTFFVDRQGRIAAKPVVGANVNVYEKVVDDILAGKQPGGEQEDTEQAQAVKNDVKQYRIYVSNTEGDLVEGAMVQLCDDKVCRVENTDKSGLAVFDAEPAEYSVHVVRQPDGYKKDDREYKLPAEYSDLNIILEKE